MISYLRPTQTSRELETLVGWFLAAATPPWWQEAVVEALELESDAPRLRVYSSEYPDEPFLRGQELSRIASMYTGERNRGLRAEFRRGQGTKISWHQSLKNEELIERISAYGHLVTLGKQKDWVRKFVYQFDENLYGFSRDHVAAQVSAANLQLLCDVGLPVECEPDFWFASEYGKVLPLLQYSRHVCSAVANVEGFAMLGTHGGHPICLTESGDVVMIDTSEWRVKTINSGLRELALSILAWERLKGQPKRLLKELKRVDPLVRSEPDGFWGGQADVLMDI